MATVRLALALMDAVVGDLEANVASITRARRQAQVLGADLVVTPELALMGYPPEDLLLKEGFVEACQVALEALATSDGLPPVLVGTAVPEGAYGVALEPSSDARDVARVPGFEQRAHVANVLAALDERGVVAVSAKRYLPNYDVFDERRYFHSGVGAGAVVNVRGVAVGLLVCEDVWLDDGPALDLVRAGATALVVANASPFARRRQDDREEMLRARARETGCPIAYVNLTGGQDELVFDGQSVVVDARGDVVARAGAFREEILVAQVEARESSAGVVVMTTSRGESPTHLLNRVEPRLTEIEEVYQALVTGTRDYLRKNGFTEALVAVSGGIDSSLVATIAVDAVGARSVRGIALPSRYSSEGSVTDAVDLAERLDIELTTLPIGPAHAALSTLVADALGEEPPGLTDENLQSRVRGVVMMAISNSTGAIVLTTGNKSELAVGFFTIYGDSAGGFAVIKDVSKVTVYELARFRNERARELGDPEPIPASVLDKPPSAELRPGQLDVQSLPPYEVLDPLLELYVDEDATAEEMIALGHDPALVRRIVRLVDHAEYKRRQTPPGVRISRKAFGRDRRMPITNAFRPEEP